MSTKREDLYNKFGPMLLEGVVLTMLDETNRIHSHVGMPEITKQDVLNELNNHLSDIEPCDWMEQEIL